MQIIFNNFTFFIHFDRKRILFININVFKKHDFDIIIYHVKNEIKYRNNLKFLIIRIDMKSIFFLNKCLTNAKNRYWFTKLKIIELIWIVKRVRYIIEISIYFVIVYIYHFVIIEIIQQIKLFNSFVDKFNLRFVKIFIYLFQFRFNVRHKFETHYVVFNVLSRLSTKKFKSSSIESILNNAYFVTSQYAYVTKLDIENSFSSKNAINNIHVEIISKFKKFIIKKYRKKSFDFKF